MKGSSGWELFDEPDHICCRTCRDCSGCDVCLKSKSGFPRQLRDVIALFPNTNTLSIRWLVANEAVHDLQPIRSGDQLRNLQRLDIALESDREVNYYDDVIGEPSQLPDAQILIDHFHLPSLDTLSIKFDVSDRTEASYLDDFEAIRGMLCGIDAPMLRRVTVTARMTI